MNIVLMIGPHTGIIGVGYPGLKKADAKIIKPQTRVSWTRVHMLLPSVEDYLCYAR